MIPGSGPFTHIPSGILNEFPLTKGAGTAGHGELAAGDCSFIPNRARKSATSWGLILVSPTTAIVCPVPPVKELQFGTL